MILINNDQYLSEPFDTESEFEDTVWSLRENLFGVNRLYFNIKKRIGNQGGLQNIPDGYLLDLTSKNDPRIFVVENELAIHGLKHIAIQVLEFSISYDASKQRIKSFLRTAIVANEEYSNIVNKYINDYNFQNIDFLLDKTLEMQAKTDIQIIVIIDQIDADLETALKEKFKFPIEILTIERYKKDEQYCYYFEPFMQEFIQTSNGKQATPKQLDIDLIDTIVVPAQEEGFNEVFLGENRWYEIRINTTMIPKIKFIAAYQVSPISAITHYAGVKSIEQWPGSSKYVVNFHEKAIPINPVKLIPKGKVKALQNSRYTTLKSLLESSNLDELWS